MTRKDKMQDAIKKLDQMSYQVTQECGTEPPFRNKYWDNKQDGIYVDIVSGEPLFSSSNKFDSGTGWPSFTKPLVENNLVEKSDTSHGAKRIEVRSKEGDSHLGHVFDDGPNRKGLMNFLGKESLEATGLRYCINSAALRFIPREAMEAEGYGDYLYLFNQEKSKTGS